MIDVPAEFRATVEEYVAEESIVGGRWVMRLTDHESGAHIELYGGGDNPYKSKRKAREDGLVTLWLAARGDKA